MWGRDYRSVTKHSGAILNPANLMWYSRRLNLTSNMSHRVHGPVEFTPEKMTRTNKLPKGFLLIHHNFI